MTSAHQIRCIILLTLVSLCLPQLALADDDCGTIVPGGNVGPVTWSKAGSPYCITGDISVTGLTIEPGVIVRVDPDVRIEVMTTIQAVGTADEMILFTARVQDPELQRWRGIRFQETQPGSELAYCRIEHAGASGLTIINSTPIVRDSVFASNYNGEHGGGIWLELAAGEIVFERCSVTGNSSRSHGGGARVINNGGSIRFAQCSFTGNEASTNAQNGSYVGGGLYITGSCDLDGCIISDNAARGCASNYEDRTTRGGGIWASEGDITLTNCIMNENLAYCGDCGHSNTRRAHGAAFYLNSGSLTATGCMFACNTLSAAHQRNGAIYINAGTAHLENVTIVRTSDTGLDGDMSSVTVLNSIIYFNNNDAVQLPEGADVTCSVVQGGYTGDGNMHYNPGLGLGCCPADLIIRPGSVCIDGGHEDAAYNDDCIPIGQGTPRNDIGAHGGPTNGFWLLPGDINHDTTVDISDLGALLAAFETLPGDPYHNPDADLNDDDAIDLSDIGVLLSYFGQTITPVE
jgi:hypothetical protein